MVLGSLCWAASVTVSAPPAPTAISMSIVSELPSELVKYGMVNEPAMSVAVMVLSVSVIENALSATVKPPNISSDRGVVPRSTPSVPLKPAEPNCMLSRSTLGPSGTLTSTDNPFWLLTVRTLPPSAVLTWPSSHARAVSIRLVGAETDIVRSRVPLCRCREGGGYGCQLLRDLVERVRRRGEAARILQ